MNNNNMKMVIAAAPINSIVTIVTPPAMAPELPSLSVLPPVLLVPGCSESPLRKVGEEGS